MNSTASCGSSDSRPTSRFQSLSDPDNLREFARNLREGIYISTRDGRILDANPAFLEMYGVASLAELQGLSGDDLVANPARHLEQLALIDRFGFVREFEVMILRPDGGVRTALNTCYLTSDPSTGEEFVHGILIDIDQFKLYNDTHGHQKGDEVLVHMARFLMRHIRAEESVIRIGGDEFVVLLAGADLGATQLVADRFRAEALRTAPVPFSIGCAAREPGESLPHLIDRADLGLMAVRVERRLSDPRGRGALDPV
jgi:diguanylate cyclase (GGDEF)-like protein